MTHTSKSRSGVERIGGLMLGLSTLVASAHAFDPSTTDPVKIVNAASESQVPSNSLARMKMTIKDSAGTRERVMSLRTKRYPDSAKAVILAEAPADLRDTGFLTVSYKEPSRTDEHWVYLPKLRRVSRVANSGKADPVLGSDFTQSDLTLSSRDSNEFSHKLIDAAGKVDNQDCWIIEAVPRKAATKSETGYDKMLLWISKEKLALLQFKAWLVDGKRIKYFKATDLRSVNGIWTPHRLNMRTLEGSTLISESLIEYLSVINNSSEVSDSDFTQQRLEQGA
jgi:outer membrane lipoprotein-sorting protein